MTSHSDVLAFNTATMPEEPARPAGLDLGDLYRVVLRQLSENVEHLVAHAFASHAAAHSLPIPPAVRAALAVREPADALHPEQTGPTGNAGLDFLNEQLQRSAAAFAQPSSVPTPPWLHPFTLPENVRFTRTPDPVLRWERSAPTAEELAIAAREAARLTAEQAARTADEERERDRARAAASDPSIPVWRRPFNLPPNVRYTRTPDLARRAALSVADFEPSGGDGPVHSEGTIHTFAVTQTVTTVGTVAIASAETGAAHDTVTPAPMIEAKLEPQPTIFSDSPLLSLSASIEQRHTGATALPGWFAMPRAIAGAPASVALESSAPAPAPADPILLEEADSDGSAALDRTAFLPDLVETTANPVAAQPIDEVVAAVPEHARAADVPALQVTAERRAFGSHGLPAFENAVHFESDPDGYEYPSVDLLAPPQKQDGLTITREGLEQNARLLEGVLEDFGIRGEIIAVRPGPVVTLYEFEPAPGVKSSRVMNLADDIARSMSAISARVAVVQGRNVIGIELPNEHRETVFLRELIGSDEFDGSNHKLAIALGKTIGGESVIVDLARMPHLLVAGTTGSGKSVAINTMILSLLYRLRPEECRLIMVDPKMLELSIYDGIPHLLTPVVTDSKKAVIALKWAVREMEDRYKKMAKVGVRNIDGFNTRVVEAKAKGEIITRTVQQGFDRETGEPVFETEEMDLSTMPYIVIIVDEMADLMMVAGKEIEGAIQRLAQMARAAGIHLIMATQRPSVDVITGTIKANFPTRISFQVTSKIDSRTILGEQGAEQLLGQGDMLHMVGGGRIARVHGPFVSDGEVEKVVWHLKAQGHPEYLDVITAEDEAVVSREAGPAREIAEDDEPQDGAVFDRGNFGDESADLYDQGVKIVIRDKKCSTSYIQRRLQVGYNKAASIVERMEKEGIVGPANGTGKREILNFSHDHSRVIFMPGNDD